MDFADFVCPACEKPFRTEQGLNSHMTTARSCSWYRRGKLADLQPFEDNDDILLDSDDTPPKQIQRDIPPGQAIQYFDEYEPLYFFPDEEEDVVLEGVAGPGPSTSANHHGVHHQVLDDDDDERVEEIHPLAGKVIAMNEDLVAKWRLRCGGNADVDGDVEMGDVDENAPNPYAPFASELDWKVARWAVKDSPGHNALNRLLEIPGVRNIALFFYEKNTKILIGCRKAWAIIS